MLLFLLLVVPSCAMLWKHHCITYSVEGLFKTNVDENIQKWAVNSLEYERVQKGGDIRLFTTQTLHKKHVVGLYYQHNHSIYIDANLSPEDEDLVIQHEFGHALGLNHTYNPESVMFPVINLNIQPKDKKLLENLYRCRYDSVTLLNNWTYIKFQGKYYDRLDFNTLQISLHSRLWHSKIRTVSAMYRNYTTGFYVILSKNHYYFFNDILHRLKTGSIKALFPNVQFPITAVLTLSNGTVLVFMENRFLWREGIVVPYPNTLPDSLQGAYELQNRILLVSGDFMYEYNDQWQQMTVQRMCDHIILNQVHCCH